MCVRLTGSFPSVAALPLKVCYEMKELTAAFRQIRVVQRRSGGLKKKSHRSPQDGGGGILGVAQVVLGVSIEGSRGSRICGGRAVRRGHGGIS